MMSEFAEFSSELLSTLEYVEVGEETSSNTLSAMMVGEGVGESGGMMCGRRGERRTSSKWIWGGVRGLSMGWVKYSWKVG